MLPITARELNSRLEGMIAAGLISPESSIYFIDDGSSDSTWELISELTQTGCRFKGIKLTRNYGHQYALYAGLWRGGRCVDLNRC